MSLTLLVVSTPRSGTNNLAQYYRSFGLTVTVEREGQDYEHIDVVIDYHQLAQVDDRQKWPVALYLTRDPIANVKSLGGLLKRTGQYRRTIKMLPHLKYTVFRNEVGPIELAARYWLHCYDTAREMNLPVIKAENVPRTTVVVNEDHDESTDGIPNHLLSLLLKARKELGYA